jgi:hypothetical protein
MLLGLLLLRHPRSLVDGKPGGLGDNLITGSQVNPIMVRRAVLVTTLTSIA